MRSLLLFLTGLLVLAPQGVLGAASSRLTGIIGEKSIDSTRLVLKVSSLPVYEAKASGRRVDLVLSGTSVAPSLQSLPQDRQIVKVLFARKGEDLIVSFLLRRPPGRVLTAALHHPSRIVLDLLWQPNASRPAVALRIGGMPKPEKGKVLATVPPHSDYAGDWLRFFRDYQTPMTLRVPLHYTLPPLPHARSLGKDASAAKKLFALARAGKWSQVLPSPGEGAAAAKGKGKPSPVLAVLRSEAQLRAGSPERALPGLDRGLASSPGEPVATWAGYLKSYLLASRSKPYQARALLEQVRKDLAPHSPFRPYLQLLQAETDLDIGRFKDALGALPKRSVCPRSLRPFVALRRADALAARVSPRRAVAAYRRMKRFPQVLSDRPLSLWQAGRTFSKSGDYRRAAGFFHLLEKRLPSSPQQAMVRLAGVWASCEAGRTETAGGELTEIKGAFSKEEAGYRAWMKLIDLEVLKKKGADYADAAANYGQIAAAAPIEGVREEAAFKQALAWSLAGQKIKSARLLETFLRDFRAGSLRPDAEALLAEVLPPAIGNLIARGEDLQAAVLAEQNRRLIPYRNMKWPFLKELAKAYGRLGLFGRAEKIYRSMLDAPGEKVHSEEAYLLLAQLYFEAGDDTRVVKCGDRYLAAHPEGKSRSAILALEVRSLRRQGKLKEAAERLQAAGRPLPPELESLAVRTFAALGQDDQVAALSQGGGNASSLGPEIQLLQAEVFYKMGRDDRALPLYEHLTGVSGFADQAHYRLAQIYLRTGKRAAAFKDLNDLVEKGKSPLWRKLAEETLQEEKML